MCLLRIPTLSEGGLGGGEGCGGGMDIRLGPFWTVSFFIYFMYMAIWSVSKSVPHLCA